MTDSLLSRVLADPSLRAREWVDEAPLEELDALIAAGRPAGVSPPLLHLARVRRAHLEPDFRPTPFPEDKAAFLAGVAESLIAALAGRRAQYRAVGRPDTLPSDEAVRAALQARPCHVVEDGALLLVERRTRLHDQTLHRPMDQTVWFVTSALRTCAPLLDRRTLTILSSDRRSRDTLWNAYAGKGVGAVWSRPLVSQRANHMLSGLHPDGRQPGPELFGEETHTVLAVR